MFNKYIIPEYMTMDLDSALMSILIKYLFKMFGINIKMVASYNNQSLQAKQSITSSATILTKHLTGFGQYWPKYLPFAKYNYNTFCSPNLNGLSPLELILGGNPRVLIDLKTDPNVKVSGTYKEYYELLNKRLEYLWKLLFDFKLKKHLMPTKKGSSFNYKLGDLVYIILSFTSHLRTSSRKYKNIEYP